MTSALPNRRNICQTRCKFSVDEEAAMAETLLYAIIPVAALIAAGAIAVRHQAGPQLLSLFQHFAAGVVIAAVALELVPNLLETASWLGMTLGYLTGLAAMLLVKRYAEAAGQVVPMAVDLFIDGLLLAIGFAAGARGGILLLVGLTLETVSLGLSSVPSMAKSGASRARIFVTLSGLGLAILVGAGVGAALPMGSGFVLAAILGFGVSALLYLVVEELLTEAHETEDTPLTTAAFFIGFFLPLLLSHAELGLT